MITDGDTVHQLTSDRNGRYRLPDQNWYAVGPEDPNTTPSYWPIRPDTNPCPAKHSSNPT